jgi:hypothetical protein
VASLPKAILENCLLQQQVAATYALVEAFYCFFIERYSEVA